MVSLVSDVVTVVLAISVFSAFLYGFYTGVNAS